MRVIKLRKFFESFEMFHSEFVSVVHRDQIPFGAWFIEPHYVVLRGKRVHQNYGAWIPVSAIPDHLLDDVNIKQMRDFRHCVCVSCTKAPSVAVDQRFMTMMDFHKSLSECRENFRDYNRIFDGKQIALYYNSMDITDLIRRDIGYTHKLVLVGVSILGSTPTPDFS